PAQRDECLGQRGAAVDAVAVGQEATERGLLRGLDLLPQRGERRATQPAQDVGLAPLARRSARPQLAPNELVAPFEREEHGLDVDAEACIRLDGREGPAAACVTKDELLERLGAALEEDLRQTARRHHAERVAIATRVLGGDQPLLAGEANEQRAPLGKQRLGVTRLVLAGAQVAAQPELVVELIGRAGLAAELRLDLLDRT